MAKFNLKEHITKNKATFFGSLTEGQFSWMTQDTGQQIGSQDKNKIPVYMFDNNGKYYYEDNYNGYGEFGGMDYYELLDKMNGGIGDRSEGIRKAFDAPAVAAGEILFPALVTDPYKFNYKTHDFTKEAKHDPNQSWLSPEEDYDEEELDENIDQPEEEGKGPSKTDLENKPETELNETAYHAPLTPQEYELVKKDMAFYYKVPEENLDGAVLDDYSTSNLKKLAPALGAKDLYSLMRKLQTAKMDARITLGTWEPEPGLPSKDIVYPKGSRMDETNKPTTKMKKSELKAKIKEMIVAEINLDVDKMEDAPESEVDFLAELEGMLNEAEGLTPLQDYVYQYEIEISGEDRAQDFLDDIKKLNTPDDVYDYYAYERDFQDHDVDNIFKQVKRKFKNLSEADDTEKDTAETDTGDDVTVDDTETIDTSTTAEVDPNVKAVQDALTQAQAAAEKLGDKKLTDQIGNTITFFTRSHVVEKGAVAEGDEMEEGKKEPYSGKSDSDFYKDIQSQYNHYKKGDYDKLKNKEYYKDAEADDAEHIKALEKDMKDDKKSSMNESMFPMLKKILK